VKKINFDKLKNTIWFDGRFIPCKNAKTHVLDHSLHFASSIFEGIRVYNFKPFKIKEHLKRFFISAKILDIKIPYKPQYLEKICYNLIKKNKIKNGYIRPLSWRGTGSMSPHSIDLKIKTIIAIWEWPTYYSDDVIKKGISLTITNGKDQAVSRHQLKVSAQDYIKYAL